MVLAMTRPTKRADSSYHQYKKRVPADIPRGDALILTLPGLKDPIGVTIGEVVKFSLRTRDPTEARIRTAAANAQIEERFKNLRDGPKPLTHKQLVALSGDAYRILVDQYQDDPGSCDVWACVKANNRAAREGRVGEVEPLIVDQIGREIEAIRRFGPDLTDGLNALPPGPDTLEAGFGKLADWVLYSRQMNVDWETRTRFIVEIDRAVTDAAWRLKRNSQGDYTPDPKETRFPPLEKKTPALSLDDLFNGWKAERKPSASTIATWSPVLRSFKEHLGHSDAKRVTVSDIRAFKDALIAAGQEPEAFSNGPLSAIRAFFSFGLDNGLVTANPTAGIRIVAKKRAGERMLPYTDEEVAHLLSICASETKPDRRWLPLLAACTGARIGELAQLWGKNVGEKSMLLTPAEDGGSFKNEGSEREVPIHSALVKAGFLDFVNSRGDGPLFYKRASGRSEARHASKGVTNHLAAWIRSKGFTHKRKAPAHAFRHWFKTKCSEIGIPDSVADAIQGHVSTDVASKYRKITLGVMAAQMERIAIPGNNVSG